jgi:hypothetical protein
MRSPAFSTLVLDSVAALLVLLGFIACVNSDAVGFTHDVGIDSVIAPRPGQISLNFFSIAARVKLRNFGSSSENNVIVTVTTSSPSGSVLFMDSLSLNLGAGQAIDTSFQEHTFDTLGTIQYVIVTHLSVDENHLNDTARTNIRVTIRDDIQTVRIVEPYLNKTIPAKLFFPIEGIFRATKNAWVSHDVKLIAVIRACGGKQILFQTDTTIAQIDPDSAAIVVAFPGRKNKFDQRLLKPGCYTISMYPSFQFTEDADHTNDTATTSFSTINDTLSHDIGVDSILFPLAGNPYGIDDSIPMIFRFKNAGKNVEDTAMVSAVATDAHGLVIYRDTVRLLNWNPEASRVVTFNPMVPDSAGVHSVYGIALLRADEFPLNDTIVRFIDVGYYNDVKAVAVVHPIRSDSIPAGKTFPLEATFKWVATGGTDQQIPFRFLIRHCDDGSLVYQVDTVLESLPLDRSTTTLFFRNVRHNMT